MRPLFPEWTDHVVRLGLACGLATLAGVPTAMVVWARTPYATGQYAMPDQPVQFDHRHHVGDDGIDCLFCHTDARRGPTAGVPATEVCMGCHGQIWNDSPLLEPVRRSAYTGEPLVWRRVNALPDFVFFNHAAHVNRGVGCVSCHGRVDRMPMVFQAERLTMRWCLDCHRAPERHLRPLDRVTDMAWWPAGTPAEAGRALRARLGVEPPTHCTGCHR
jgi:hypothetical protein